MNHAEQVALLFIERGADVHRTGPYENTALYNAATRGGNAVLVRALIKAGANVNAAATPRPGPAETPLAAALREGHPEGGRARNQEIIALLRAAGAKE